MCEGNPGVISENKIPERNVAAPEETLEKGLGSIPEGTSKGISKGGIIRGRREESMKVNPRRIS